MRTTKKALSIVLAGLMTVGGMSVFSVSAAQTSTPTLSFKTQNALYAHAVSGSDDSDAWVAWQCKHNEDMEELNTIGSISSFQAVFRQQALSFITHIQKALRLIM